MRKLLLYGVHLFFLGIIFYLLGFIFRLFPISSKLSSSFFYIANVLFIFGIFLAFFNWLFSLRQRKYKNREIFYKPLHNPSIAVGMTAYNDEASIEDAVKDFIQVENVKTVVVVDNNSTDNTSAKAMKAKAKVVREITQGYGAACIRALKEASKYGDFIVLVEGDGTFSGADIKKFVAYIENVDMVVGTRTTRELNSPRSQMNWFIQYGNIFMAKLIQLIFWETRLTDVGCTFRMIRKEALDKIIDQLTVTGNHFSPHMILVALKNGIKTVEIPITFKERIGESKGVGRSIWRGLKTGLLMWWMILTS